MDPASAYNLMCPTCILSNQAYYYCTLDDTCRSTPVDNLSCEKDLLSCLAYRTNDLGVKEIPPFTTIKASFNYTVSSTKAVRFAISNQDSKNKGWFKVMVKNAPVVESEDQIVDVADDSTEIVNLSNEILPEKDPGLFIKYFDQNSGDMKTDFVYSKTGKSYLKPLNTRFLYIYAVNNTKQTVRVMYGNTKYSVFGLSFQLGLVSLAILSILII